MPLRVGLQEKDRETMRFMYQMALQTFRMHSPSNTSSNRIQTLRVTHQRSHLTVEADLPLRHVVGGAEPQRVEEAFFSKALASKLI